jgi:hypothetical protein
VREDGFEYQAQRYRSLTVIAERRVLAVGVNLIGDLQAVSAFLGED